MPERRALLEHIRRMAAERMGMIADPARLRGTPAMPLLGMVGRPAACRNALAGGMVAEPEVDLAYLLMCMQQTHKTYTGASTVCTGVAAQPVGALVHMIMRPHNQITIRIGQRAGVIETETEIEPDGMVRRVTFGRTARRILEGTVLVPDEWSTAMPKIEGEWP
jgi:2-methylaconitate cis-trans-isomerase PrpF